MSLNQITAREEGLENLLTSIHEQFFRCSVQYIAHLHYNNVVTKKLS